MATFTVWKYDTPDGAERAQKALRAAEADGIVTIIDRAIVSWPLGADRPTTHHSHDSTGRATGWGAFWGLLFGILFFIPVIGAATGAAIGAISKTVGAVGIDSEQLDTIRAEVTPGTSALFAMTEDADMDRLGERMHGLKGTLIATNLTPAERKLLLETFG